MVNVKNLDFYLSDKRQILKEINFQVGKGHFLAVLGENGAGKTTLLDILMGFRCRSNGEVYVLDKDPQTDPWQNRLKIAYLSEKIDLPGDWNIDEFLDFNRAFYSNYDISQEEKFMSLFGIEYKTLIGNLSAGEMRRLQIVSALSACPELIIADEITAVLDILGRRKFLGLLHELQKESRVTVILSTNIPEGLDNYADYILLLNKGKQIKFSSIENFISDFDNLANSVANYLGNL